jgi:hypothetical protein
MVKGLWQAEKNIEGGIKENVIDTLKNLICVIKFCDILNLY